MGETPRQDKKEPNSELMAEAMAKTAEAVKRIPEQAFANPKDFAIELYKNADAFFKEAEQEYGGLEGYTIPVSEQVLKLQEIYKGFGSGLEVSSQQNNLDEDCRYGFVSLSIAEYVSRNYSGPFFETLVKAIKNREARNFLQQDQIKEIPWKDISNGRYLSSKKFDGFSKEEFKDLVKYFEQQKGDVEKFSSELILIHDFPRSAEGVNILKSTNVGDLANRSSTNVDHIIGTTISILTGKIYNREANAEDDHWEPYPQI